MITIVWVNELKGDRERFWSKFGEGNRSYDHQKLINS